MNKDIFIEELKKINITIDEDKQNKLDMYYTMLVEENNKYNLTSITTKEDVYLKHFYDSLTLSKIINLNNQSLCDIGTGAGFPGLVLKIVFSSLKVTLIDATLKKCNFLNKVINTLKLKDIEVINARAEEEARLVREKYDIVTSRAVAPLKHLLEYSVPLVKVGGYFIPMKGKEELNNLDKYLNKLDVTIEKVEKFHLPIENSERTIIKFKKNSITNLNYPRKYSEIKKKEL